MIPPDATRVFHAPYVEEIDGSRFQRDPEFWSVWRNGENLFVKTTFPQSADQKNGLLKLSTGSKEWELYLDVETEKADPLEYPLDGLILYYLTVLSGDIMIHASGINHQGKGYIFSGVSGKGKTTMSRLWSDAGAQIIHDDRLIIRHKEGMYRIYNTPVYDNEQPWQSPLHRIYIIEHASKNFSTRVNGAAAVSLVMANCIQQNWGPEIIERLLESVSAMCEEIPVFRLGFLPDQSIIEYITKNE